MGAIGNVLPESSHRNGSKSHNRRWPTTFGKVLLSGVFASILVRQYRYSRIAATYHSERLREADSLGFVQSTRAPDSAESIVIHSAAAAVTTTAEVTTAKTTAPEQTTPDVPAAEATVQTMPPALPMVTTASFPSVPDTVPLDVPSSSPTHRPTSMPTKDLASMTAGERWIFEVTKLLRIEERARKVGKNRVKKQNVRKDFTRLRNRLAKANASSIDDPSHWHAVTPEGYRETLTKARASMDEMIERVYTDCVLWLVPPDNLTAMEVEMDDWEDKIRKNSKAGPWLRFQCGRDDDQWQETPCRSANLCLVRSDPLRWREYYHAEDGQTIIDTTVNGTNATFVSHYNHTELEHRFAPPDEAASATIGKKSAILTMVDTIHYLRSGKPTKRPRKGPSYFIWESFLNKASYALRTNRDLYLWIGGFPGDSDKFPLPNGTDATNMQPVLHQRNTDVLKRTFGANCLPESARKNVVHYYKPIAFGVLFRQLRRQQREQQQPGASSDDEQRVWFVDADIFFNPEAFPGNHSDEDSADEITSAMSLDDYFDISPQASLLGSQNPSAKQDNILINGGLIGLRSGGRSNGGMNHGDGLDDWVLNLSALWWYCRCGERDQIALWLILFATWSAESFGHNGNLQHNDVAGKGSAGNGIPSNGETIPQFAYPRVAFENYLFSWVAVIPHAWAWLPSLQQAWSQQTANAASKSNPLATTSSYTTTPTNTSLYNGGPSFWNSTRGGMYSYPLELPHVLLLPLEPFVVPETPPDVTTTESEPKPPTRRDFYLGIARKTQKSKKTLLTHDKNRDDVCYNFRCWPYLIREDPGSLRDLRRAERRRRREALAAQRLSDPITFYLGPGVREQGDAEEEADGTTSHDPEAPEEDAGDEEPEGTATSHENDDSKDLGRSETDDTQVEDNAREEDTTDEEQVE